MSDNSCIIGCPADSICMKGFSLTASEIAELKRLHRQLPHRRDADKVKAVILLGTGWSIEQVSEILLLDERTLRRYVERYRQEPDIESWLTTFYCGSQPKLSGEQMTLLDQHICEHIYPAAAAIVEYVQDRFDIQYTVNGMTSLLHRMGYTYKKPKAVPGKADEIAQRQFVQQYESLKSSKKPDDPIYFMDGVHPQHNSVTAYGWIKKGHTQTIKSNTGRAKLNLNGAVNPQTCEVVVRADQTINAQSTIELLKMLEDKHRKAETIYVIADNARYYRSSRVQQYLADSRIKLIFLPTYSPNLNLIERLWKYFRKMVLYNQYYETFLEFKERALAFFANIKEHKAALRRLLTENFEIIAA
jgi:transposase